MSNKIEITDIVIETIIEKKPRKKWTAQNPRKKREEKIRKPSKYEDGLPFDNIRYKYNRTYYEKNREKMLQKMKEKYQSKSKKNKISNAIGLLEKEGIIKLD
jgi:hypothetical protein